MKKYVLLGVIALVMLLSVPAAMAVVDPHASTVELSGPLVASYSIAALQTNGAPGSWLSVGDNDWVWGTLTITASNTAWAVSAVTDQGNSQMYYESNPNVKLTQQLTQWTPDASAWVVVHNYLDSGTIAENNKVTTLKYRQTVLSTDAPATYKLKIIYSIAAV